MQCKSQQSLHFRTVLLFNTDLLSHFDITPQLFHASGGRSSYNDIAGPVVTTQVTIPKDVSEWQILTDSQEYLHSVLELRADISLCHSHCVIALFLILEMKKMCVFYMCGKKHLFHLHGYYYSPVLSKCFSSSSPTLFVLFPCLSTPPITAGWLHHW